MNYRLKNLFLFLFFLGVTIVLYSGTIHSKFVFDFIDWFFTYQKQGWHGILHSFNDPSLHHVYHLFFFSATKLLGTNDFAWYILFCSLHSLNAFLFFILLKKWLFKAQVEYSFIISIVAALFFLVSPYQTEVVVWGATIHYLLVVCFALLILHFFLLFADTPKRKYLIAIYLLFFAALFTHEIIIVLPIVIFLIVFTSYPQQQKVIFFKVVLPLIVLIAFYFLLTKIILGRWIAHYGAETHLHFDVWQLQTAFVRYVCKYLLLAQFLPETTKNFIYRAIENHHYRVLACLLSMLLLLVIAGNKKIVAAKSMAALLLISFIALFPVLNLYFPYWINIHADRLGYFASLFLYSFLALLMFSIFRKFGFLIAGFFLFLEVSALQQNTNSWRQASILMKELEENFPADTSKHYYLLNLPDNYNGAYMFRCLGDSKFAQTLRLKTNIDRTSQITEVLSYNLLQPDDSATVTVIDSLKLKIELSNPGSWWWRYTLGATDYEDENVKVDLDNYGHSYLVTFKKRAAEDVFLYQTESNWREVKEF